MTRKAMEALLWALGIASATSASAAFLFSTFETKEHALQFRGDIKERLDRMEGKLDRILGQ